jgi:hypothetical protein
VRCCGRRLFTDSPFTLHQGEARHRDHAVIEQLLADLTAGPRGATIRARLIDVAARLARRGRGHLILHLSAGWHHRHEGR